MSEPLLGRETAIVDIRVLMASARVVTLVGAGGIGKTSIALEIAYRVARDECTDVRIVELAAHTTRPSVIRAIASALGLQFNNDEANIRTLVNALLRVRGLLVIDNVEHVAHHVAEIVEMIGHSGSHVRILVTGRRRLHAPGEVVYRVGPLARADACENTESKYYSPSARLFLRRLSSNAMNVELNENRIKVVEEICLHLGGSPLALELAAECALTLPANFGSLN